MRFRGVSTDPINPPYALYPRNVRPTILYPLNVHREGMSFDPMRHATRPERQGGVGSMAGVRTKITSNEQRGLSQPASTDAPPWTVQRSHTSPVKVHPSAFTWAMPGLYRVENRESASSVLADIQGCA